MGTYLQFFNHTCSLICFFSYKCAIPVSIGSFQMCCKRTFVLLNVRIWRTFSVRFPCNRAFLLFVHASSNVYISVSSSLFPTGLACLPASTMIYDLICTERTFVLLIDGTWYIFPSGNHAFLVFVHASGNVYVSVSSPLLTGLACLPANTTPPASHACRQAPSGDPSGFACLPASTEQRPLRLRTTL